MREFNIDKIGKKMPYKEPSEEFFTMIEERIVREAQQEIKPAKIINIKTIVASLAVAATLLIGVFVMYHDNATNPVAYQVDELAVENLSDSIDSYLDKMSDADIQMLATQGTDQDDFYSILP